MVCNPHDKSHTCGGGALRLPRSCVLHHCKSCVLLRLAGASPCAGTLMGEHGSCNQPITASSLSQPFCATRHQLHLPSSRVELLVIEPHLSGPGCALLHRPPSLPARTQPPLGGPACGSQKSWQQFQRTALSAEQLDSLAAQLLSALPSAGGRPGSKCEGGTHISVPCCSSTLVRASASGTCRELHLDGRPPCTVGWAAAA